MLLRGYFLMAHSKAEPYDYVNLQSRLRNIATTGGQVKRNSRSQTGRGFSDGFLGELRLLGKGGVGGNAHVDVPRRLTLLAQLIE